MVEFPIRYLQYGPCSTTVYCASTLDAGYQEIVYVWLTHKTKVYAYTFM